jgi:hypothetical protein
LRPVAELKNRATAVAEIKQKRTPLDTVKAVVDFEDQIKAKVAATQTRRKLWQALNEFISRRGGYLISPPHAKRLCVEVPQYSTLPDELIDLGYNLQPGGANTRAQGSAVETVESSGRDPGGSRLGRGIRGH